MSVARPVCSSASMMTAFSRGLPVAVSKRAGIAVEKPPERRLDLDADDRIVRAGHADVGQIRRALRQDALVGRLHVRVRADHGRHLAVEVPAHGDLLRRRLGVEVDEDDRAPASRSASISRARPRTDRRCCSMNTRPMTLMTPTERPSRCARDSCRCRARRRGSWPAAAAAARRRCSRSPPSCPRCDCRTSSRRRPSRAADRRSRG